MSGFGCISLHDSCLQYEVWSCNLIIFVETCLRVQQFFRSVRPVFKTQVKWISPVYQWRTDPPGDHNRFHLYSLLVTPLYKCAKDSEDLH